MITIIFGALPCFIMPIYSFDYYSCHNRNSVYKQGGFPVYFQEFMVTVIFITVIAFVTIKVLFH
jgi:hypothetical protein